jgi:hypothetical protein
MAHFDHLPGVFELARIHQKTSSVVLTYDEYLRYLSIWNDLPDTAQIHCLRMARQRNIKQ